MSQLFDFSLGEKPWGKPKTKKTRENQKTKKPKLFRECLVWGSFLVFFGFPWVFLVFFGHDLEKTKKNSGFFLVFWINWWSKTCEKPKKLRSFLVFCMDCFYMSSKNLSKKPKETWVFLVFCLTSSKSSFKKPKKPWVFLFFSRSWPKKTKKTRGKQKKKWASDQTFSKKFWFFGFLVFSRFRGTNDSLGEKPWGTPKKKAARKPKNQKTKTFQIMFGLRFMFVFFWFSSSFFWFFWSWAWKN